MSDVKAYKSFQKPDLVMQYNFLFLNSVCHKNISFVRDCPLLIYNCLI